MSRRIVYTLALVLSILATLHPGFRTASAQTDLRDGVYVDPGFGFGVSWDPDVFEGTEIVGEDDEAFGVTLEAAGVYGQIYAAGFSSTRACLNGLTGDFEELEGVSRFVEADDLALPESDPDARAAVYTYDFQNQDTGDESSWAHYFECRDLLIDGEPAEDVVLAISIDIAVDDYETVIADFEPVLTSIEFDATGGATDNGDSTGSDADVGLGDGVYIDPAFGWAVSWDAAAYDAEELVTDEDVVYGVNLAGADVFAEIFGGTYTSPRNCLNTLTDNLEGIDGVTNFEEADDLDLLKTDPDARAGLYRYDYENADGEESSWVRYFECRAVLAEGEPVEDAFVVVSIDFAETEYETVVADFEEIVASIEFDAAGGGNRDNGNAGRDDLEPGVNGNVYLDETYGYAVTWDEAVFTGEGWDPDETGEVLGVQLAAETGAFMTFFVQEATSVRSCVNGRADSISGGAFDNFEEIEAELPETGPDARQVVWQGIFTTSEDEELDILLYSECSPLIVDGEEVEGQFLAVDLIATPAEYEDLLPAISEALTSVTFDAAAGGSSSGDDPAEDPTEEPAEEDPSPDPSEESAGGIDEDTYVSSLGYSISWDDSANEATLIDEENPDLGVSISSPETFMLVQTAGDASLEACVEAEAQVVGELSGISDFGTSRLDGPEAPRRTESGTFGATLTFDNGDEAPVFIYIQCTELGEFEGATLAVVVRIISIEETYEEELPVMQALIDSLEITGPAQEG